MMIVFVCVALFTLAGLAALMSLADSALRGKRAHDALRRSRAANRARPTVARIVIISDIPTAATHRCVNAIGAFTRKGRPLQQPANCLHPAPAAA